MHFISPDKNTVKRINKKDHMAYGAPTIPFLSKPNANALAIIVSVRYQCPSLIDNGTD